MIKHLLPENFLFTQYSIATFDNCPLKFKKRYLENLKWESVPDEDIKKRLEMGNSFHLLARRYFMGIDTGLESVSEDCSELNIWIENLKKSFKLQPDAVYLPEHKLRMVSGKLKLEANFDLLVVNKSGIQIWDWKTHGERTGKKSALDGKRLKESLQTMVYLFVLKEQCKLVTDGELECENITMDYWQPDPPRVIAQIKYNSSMHEQFRQGLEAKVQYILEYDYSTFDKGLYSKHCRFCEFNWFCNNERVDFKALDESDDFEFSWDDVEERY